MMTPSIAAIQRAVCDHYGISVIDMLSRRRRARTVLPRQLAMYIARHQTHHSLPEIGRMFDRDHTTVIWAINKVTTLRKQALSLNVAHEAVMRKIIDEPIVTDEASYDAGYLAGYRAALRLEGRP